VAGTSTKGVAVKGVRRFFACTVGVMVVLGGLAMLTGSAALAGKSPDAQRFLAVRGSAARTTDAQTGLYKSSRMTIEVMLAPRNERAMTRRLSAAYNPRSRAYHRWLARGQFTARYAPSAATRAAVAAYLRAQGLVIERSSSPFLVRAAGSSARIGAAFRTTLSTYRNQRGVSYFSNSRVASLPSAIAPRVMAVLGLSNTLRYHSMIVRAHGAAASHSSPSCEAGYPTRHQLFDYYNHGVNFPTGYGGGPGCQGLTPSQTNSLYNAPNAGARGKGRGITTGLFELSAYQRSDIRHWAHTFFGHHYNPPLVDVNVDGGPLNPQCPAGDTCPPDFNGYAGDIEVDADIQMQLAMAPAAKHVVVYNAPNDYTGQTELDEWARIANSDRAASVSSSWGLCENDAGAGYAEAENLLFVQMAMQGQSVFGASGDTGAFSCIRSDGSTIVNVVDPPSQPWVTSVGGTSFEHFNPGAKQHPSYPKGVESVWNVDNLCRTSSIAGFDPFFFCAATGAGGGGASQFWGRPHYQRGPGVNNPFTTHGNGTTQCSLAAIGKPCREVPDISANADEYTPYAEYCTGDSSTPNSVCATFSGAQTPPGWFGIGGTSLSSPLWSGIIADRDSYHGGRSGNVNPMLYRWLRNNPSLFFHDITRRHTARDNGLFPATRHYDEATGIGTPNMRAIITAG
jgi:subtilase family serine protease